MGIEQGRVMGREEGIEKNRMSSLCSLMKNLGLSLEQAMAALEIPDKDRPKYQSLIEKQ